MLQGTHVQLHSMTGDTARAHWWTITFQGQTLVRSAFQLRSTGEDASLLQHGCVPGSCPNQNWAWGGSSPGGSSPSQGSVPIVSGHGLVFPTGQSRHEASDWAPVVF